MSSTLVRDLRKLIGEFLKIGGKAFIDFHRAVKFVQILPH